MGSSNSRLEDDRIAHLYSISTYLAPSWISGDHVLGTIGEWIRLLLDLWLGRLFRMFLSLNKHFEPSDQNI
jgi:hypothetical protein